ncbi:MAG TPA: hypothetical protein VHX44_01545 [Planctomycetota bacterium]|nr:hypothetical protein [Planctomycetota bacterium]
MANDHHSLRTLAEGLTSGRTIDELNTRLAAKPGARRENLGGGMATPEAVAKR